MLTSDTVSRPLDLEESLRDDVVDLAIDWLPVQLDPFVNRKLFDDRLVLLARRGHPSVDSGVTMEGLQKAEFVTIHHRRDIEHAPMAIKELLELGIREAVHVSELLEIPVLVASTDLVGIFAASMGPLMEQRLGLQVLPFPLAHSEAGRTGHGQLCCRAVDMRVPTSASVGAGFSRGAGTSGGRRLPSMATASSAGFIGFDADVMGSRDLCLRLAMPVGEAHDGSDRQRIMDETG